MTNLTTAVIRCDSVPMDIHEAACPHACKQFVDWLSDFSVACACFICKLYSSEAVDAFD